MDQCLASFFSRTGLRNLLTQILTLTSPVAMANIPGPTHAVWFSFDLVLTLILEISDSEPSASTCGTKISMLHEDFCVCDGKITTHVAEFEPVIFCPGDGRDDHYVFVETYIALLL
jgi:hypothetical protein